MEVLFVCTGNTCRSPMAQGIFNDLAIKSGLNSRAKSAGIFARDGGPISAKAIEALKELEIDISSYYSKTIESIDLDRIDLVLVMGNRHKGFLNDKYPQMSEKVFLLNEDAFYEKRDIEDPFGGDLKVYKSARDEIHRAIMEIIRREKNDSRNS